MDSEKKEEVILDKQKEEVAQDGQKEEISQDEFVDSQVVVKQSKKIKTKDLILIGVYTALYLIAIMIAGLIGWVPQLYPYTLFTMPLFGGIPFMLFLTKVKKFGIVTIMSIVVSLIFFASGHGWIILCCTPFAILADIIMYKFGRYENIKFNIVGYALFSILSYGMLLPFYVYREKYIEQHMKGISPEYALAVDKVMGDWVLYVGIIFIIVGAILGGLLGHLVVKKQFKKAGIVEDSKK